MANNTTKQDASERTINNSKRENEGKPRPNDLPNLYTNHTSAAVSPVNSNAWNSDSWADGEFEPLEETTSLGEYHSKFSRSSPIHLRFSLRPGNSKLDEAKRKREEKKNQRQRELEARRVARGPLKLGAKKL